MSPARCALITTVPVLFAVMAPVAELTAAPAAVGRLEDGRRRCRMEVDEELPVARRQDLGATRADEIRVLGNEPLLDVGEQPLRGRHPGDDPAFRCQADDLNGKRQAASSCELI